jgi:hypothetical protein
MSWNKPPDAYPGESQSQYNARKEQEQQQEEEVQPDTAVLDMLFSFSIFAFKIAAIFGVFIYAGFLLSKKLLGEETDKVKIWVFALLFTYLIFCILYFLKGTIIGLRARNRTLWILPWIICVLLCCFIPAFILKTVVRGMFHLAERQSMWCLGLSWSAFVFLLLYTYEIYQFKTPTAPRILYWSYALGLKVSL